MTLALPLVWDIDIRGKTHAFNYHFSFQSHHNLLSVIGNNGAGKSTLLKLLAGVLTPDEGRIRLLGRPLFESETETNLSPQQRWCGYIPQNKSLFPHLTVVENIVFALKARAQTHDLINTAMSQLHAFGLQELENRRPETLSGGEYQRVAMARALLQSNAYLLMDEPLNALDVENRASLRRTMRTQLEQEKTPALITTHDDRDARALTQEVLLVDSGSIAHQLVLTKISELKHPFTQEFFRLNSQDNGLK